MNKERSATHKVNQTTYARLLSSLMDDPASTHDLVEVTGLHLVTVQSLMRVLRQHKVVRIVAWEKDRRGRDVTPIFELGRGPDKKRAKQTPAERQAKTRERRVQRLLAAASAGAA